MITGLDLGPTRFKCPFRLDPKHCAACRADYDEQRRLKRMKPQQRAAETRKRRAKLRKTLAAIVKIGRMLR